MTENPVVHVRATLPSTRVSFAPTATPADAPMIVKPLPFFPNTVPSAVIVTPLVRIVTVV